MNDTMAIGADQRQIGHFRPAILGQRLDWLDMMALHKSLPTFTVGGHEIKSARLAIEMARQRQCAFKLEFTVTVALPPGNSALRSGPCSGN